MIKCINIPVIIAGSNSDLRLVKYKALDLILQEAKYLGNKAIRFCIAYDLTVNKEKVFIPLEEDGSTVAISTAIYRHLAQDRKFLPSGCMATLANNYASKMFRAHTKDAWKGIKSLPTYRNPILPIRHKGTTYKELLGGETKQFYILPSGFSKKWLAPELVEAAGCKMPDVSEEYNVLAFKTVFSWKDAGSIAILERIISGEYAVKDATLRKIWKYDKATNKKKPHYYFATVYDIGESSVQLDKTTVCGVDLGVKIPVYCALNTGPQRFAFGSFDDVWAARSKFRGQRRRKQVREGRDSKNVQWEQSETEKNWVNNFYHTATRAVIKFCLKNNCGTIHGEDLSGLRTKELNDDNGGRKRLIWVPSKFNTMPAYKAKEVNIDVIKINPRNTSRRCSSCGYIDKENRLTQDKFCCITCGEEMNADYNAAKNISLASGDVIEKGYLKSA